MNPLPPHVCLDAQSAVRQRAGVGRYTRQLALHLGAMPDAVRLTLAYFDFHRRGRPFDAPGAAWKPMTRLPGRAVQWAWKTVGAPAFDRLAGPADVYHFPNFIIPPLRRGRAVVTIHDVSFLRHPAFAETRNRRYLAAHIRDTVDRAAAVITDSQFSAGEITAHLGVDPHRLHAIPLGIEPGFAPADPEAVARMRRRYGLSRPYLLAVGTLEPRKNLGFMVDVFDALTGFDGELVLAGMPGWHTGPIFERIARSPRAASIRRLDYVDDATLPALYSGAAILLQTSVYEGFGFPPLEAMACGTPAVVSAGGSLPEIAGDAASVVPVFEIDAWRAAIGTLLDDTAARERAVAAARRHAARYSWEAAARRTLDVYLQVAA